MTRPRLRRCLSAVAMPTALVLMAVLMPHVTGVGWSVTTERIEDIAPTNISLLVAVWALGLWLHTFTLRGSLPGLGIRRALALNLGGSSVSNVLPFGGAAGIGLNYAMLRSWGYSRTEISAFATISNVVVAVMKAVIAIGGIVAIAVMPSITVAQSLRSSSRLPVAAAVLGAVVGVVVTLLFFTARGRARLEALRAGVRETLATMAHALRRGWHLISVGGIGYPLLQSLLLWMCLQAVGAPVSIVAALTAYAVERLVTLVPLTPGGVGVVEAAATATLVAFGVDPAGAAGGVILFRVFSFFIEIPLGGILAMTWWVRHRGARPIAAQPATAA